MLLDITQSCRPVVHSWPIEHLRIQTILPLTPTLRGTTTWSRGGGWREHGDSHGKADKNLEVCLELCLGESTIPESRSTGPEQRPEREWEMGLGKGGHLFCGKTTIEHQAVHKVTPGHENPKSTFVPETFQTKFYKEKGQGRGEEEKEKGKETMKRTK